MEVKIGKSARFSEEYGGAFRRIFPWENVVNTPWGSAWMKLRPGTRSTLHAHDEKEVFIILSGEGEMTVDDETRPVGKGDVVYLPPFSRHSLKNMSQDETLELLCIWWDAGAAGAAEAAAEA